MDKSEAICIVMFLWGDQHYGLNDVNAIVARVVDLARRDIEICLITDRPREGLHPHVRQLQMPKRFCDANLQKSGHCQAKLSMFEHDLLPKGRRCIYIDIDTLVLSDPTVAIDLCKDAGKIYMLPATAIPVGWAGRIIWRLSKGRKYPRGNSSVLVFTAGQHGDIANTFIELYKTKGIENCRELIVDDRFISWKAYDRLAPMPGSFAASIRRVFMTRFRALGWMRSILPHVAARRTRLALLTLDDPAVKILRLADMAEGTWVSDQKGRKLKWSKDWMGKTYETLTHPNSQIFSVKYGSGA